MINQKLRKIINHHLSKVLEYNALARFEGVSDKNSFLLIRAIMEKIFDMM